MVTKKSSKRHGKIDLKIAWIIWIVASILTVFCTNYIHFYILAPSGLVSAVGTAQIFIVGVVPRIHAVNVLPVSPTDLQDLNCSVNFTDPDTSTALANFTWYQNKNGSFVHETSYDATGINCTSGTFCYTTALVSNTDSNHRRGVTWVCEVSVYDTTGLKHSLNGSEVLLTANLSAPHMSISLSGTHNAYLNWTNITNADNYTLYYSSDVNAIKSVTPGSLPDGVINITELLLTNYTDNTAGTVKNRYYRVGSVAGPNESISDDVMGIFKYELIGTNTGSNDNKRKNWIGIGYLNTTYMAETFISNVPGDAGIRVSKLVREDSNSYEYYTHDKHNAPTNYTMSSGVGYEIEVSGNVSYTLT